MRIINALTQPGASMKQVGKDFQLHTMTIKREVSFAEREGLLKQVQDSLANDLIPKAMAVYAQHLEIIIKQAAEENAAPPDLEAARDILKGTQIFSSGAGKKSLLDAKNEEMTLEGYISNRGELKGESESSKDSGRVGVIEGTDQTEPDNTQVLRDDDDQ